VAVKNFIKIVPLVFFLINIWNHGEHYETPCIIRRMRIACWMPKTTNTQSGCVVLIAYPLHQWSHEFASMLHYTYTACLVPHAGVALL